VGKKTRDVHDFFESVLVMPLRICLKDCTAVVELRAEKKFPTHVNRISRCKSKSSLRQYVFSLYHGKFVPTFRG